LDEEFEKESAALFDMARRGDAIILVSDLLIEELSRAPEGVRGILPGLPPECIEDIERSDESRRLQEAYLRANVLASQSENDAHHVALATIAGADVIASWNFKHIVHLDKIRLFNAVNLKEGYGLMDIRSPREIA